jgi:hypothetical protein
MSPERQARRELAEANFEEFIKLVYEKRLLGNVHREVINFITRSEAKSHQMILLPRDHGKSALAGYFSAWLITRNPAVKILYISSTSNLATKQLKFIKDILTSDIYRLYWPEMVEKDEAKREKWTEREISVDHPLRKAEAVRDPTVFTAGLTTNIVGMHSDWNILDDVVVAGNAYMEEGRNKVREQYGYLSSILSGEGRELVVGTRYHPLDLYGNLLQREVNTIDEYGNITETTPLFEVFERKVESVGDGSGEFLWPRQQRSDGKWFGFNREILERKKASYSNRLHFRAQYYNDPHDIDDSPISRDRFQYYDTSYLSNKSGRWFFKGGPLNVVAAVDFAFSTAKGADYTSLCVVGVDGSSNFYVLDIDRFKTNQVSEYYKHILKLHEKWGFRKLRAEVTAGQAVIVNDLKENYIRKHGLSLTVDEYRPSRWVGSKDERILATLEPRYANGQMWHPKSGNIQILEEELMSANPPHDDVKDTLASAVDLAQAMVPKNIFRQMKDNMPVFNFHDRFGGVTG